MKKIVKPSLAVRALTRLVEGWPIYSHGDYISGNLSLAGFNVIDQGNFSSVIEGNPNQVIKVFGLNDIGYQFLINYCKQITNTHLPNIISFTKSGNYGIVETEILHHNTKVAVTVSEYVDRVKFDRINIKDPWGLNFRHLVVGMNNTIMKINQTSKSRLSWDLHENNIMFRGTTPVMVDAIYGEA